MVDTMHVDGREHLRRWSPTKKKSSKQTGKIHSELEKMRSDFLSDNQWVILCRFSETCSPPKGIKGTREGYIADFSFLLRLSWGKPIIKLFTESILLQVLPEFSLSDSNSSKVLALIILQSLKYDALATLRQMGPEETRAGVF